MGTESKKQVVLPRLNIQYVNVTVRGLTSLIVHNWSEKAKKQMRDKQQKAATMKKEAKDPVADFEGAKYRDAKGRDCVRALFFKNAIVSACRYADDLKMTILRGALFVEGDYLPIKFDHCVMREDMVRVGMGTADMRYRPEYQGWSVDLRVSYNEAVLSADQVLNLIRLAGYSVGICEWRPECSGDYGRFDIELGRKAA